MNLGIAFGCINKFAKNIKGITFHSTMRRSAAPSVISSLKKHRFTVPYARSPAENRSLVIPLKDLGNSVPKLQKSLSSEILLQKKEINSDNDLKPSEGKFPLKRSKEEVLKLLLETCVKDTNDEESFSTPQCQETNNIAPSSPLLDACKLNITLEVPQKTTLGFYTDTFSSNSRNHNEHLEQDLDNVENTSGTEHSDANANTNTSPSNHGACYSVVWCKRSMKKHKKWEGDAVLIIKGRSGVLKDLEGKEIARGIGYKAKEVSMLEEGSSFFIGGKECEIQYQITEEDYLSGRCYQQSSLTPAVIIQPSVKTPLRKPLNKSESKKCDALPFSNSINSDTAFFMPRPSSIHQWKHNKLQLNIVDVIVEPNLAKQLRSHQKEGIVFLYECILGLRDYSGQGAILADEMGLGKTLQCIALIWTLYKQGPYGGKPILKKVLIITPSSLVKNWEKEFYKWLGKGKISVFPVDQNNRVQDFLNSQSAVLIISYEMFVRSTEILSAVPFDLVICDEGHRLKNTNIKTSNVIMCLPTKRRILLTGTPIQNDLEEFYSIVEFTNPGVLGTISAFRRLFEEPIMKSRHSKATIEEKQIGEARAAELARLTGLFVLRRTQEVINKYLPAKMETVVFCQPTPFQLRLYNHILKSRAVASCLSSGKNTDGTYHLMCISALRKLCNHPSLLYTKAQAIEEDDDHRKDDSFYHDVKLIFPTDYKFKSEDSGKMRVLEQLLSSMFSMSKKEKIVLVSSFTQTLDILEEHCNDKGYPFLRLDGSTPVSSRQSMVESFNTPFTKYVVFLLSSKAGGVGFNLIGASRILLYDVDWNPANDLQAMARVWRDGQKHPVCVYRLLTAGTIEEKIYQRQVSKQGLSGTVIDSKNFTKSQFSVDELRDLFTLHENVECQTHNMLQCHCMDGGCHNKDESDPKVTVIKERPCQLGLSKYGSLIKNIGMAELLQWDHIPGYLIDDDYSLVFLYGHTGTERENQYSVLLLQEFSQDFCLRAGKKDITFLFRNEINGLLK